MPSKKVSACTVKRQLRSDGVDFSEDYHALSFSDKDRVVEGAKRAKYRKSKTASGSRGRMFFQYLKRKKC